MPKILIVKTSSLGDVVHNLPVVSDIRRARKDAGIDWVVEKSFASIPTMHPGVRRVIHCDFRQWRSSWWSRPTRRALSAFVNDLRTERYDFVIDTQGLLKSAVVARMAHGRKRIGLDWQSSREPLRPFYDEVFKVPWSLHAVERNRRLAALGIGYEPTGELSYGISAMKWSNIWSPCAPYTLLLHGASHARKCWPESHWQELGARLGRQHYSVLLPWGNDAELLRAKRLAAAIPAAQVTPKLDIAGLASVIAGARVVVGLDSGLAHLAAALGIPVVGIFGATDPSATGVRAPGRVANVGGVGRFPSVEEVLAALRSFEIAL